MFKQLKEEMWMIPILMLVVEFLRRVLMYYCPECGTFMPETELLVFAVKFWQFLWITTGVWLLLRIVFPSIYKHLSEDIYDRFNEYSNDAKTKISLYVFGLFLIGFILLFNGAKGQGFETLRQAQDDKVESQLRQRLCDTLSKQLYVRELTNHNDGTEVKRYLNYVGLPEGFSWCAAYVSYNLGTYHVPAPRSARAKDFSPTQPPLRGGVAQPVKVLPGDVFTLYYTNLHRVGHVGFIIETVHGYYRTNEGNTGSGGVREGSGVHSYLRNPQTIYGISNYISLKFTRNENKAIIYTTYSLFGIRNGLQSQVYKEFGKGTNSQRSNGGFEFIQYQTNLQGYSPSNRIRYKFDSFRCTRTAEFETHKNRNETTKNHSTISEWKTIRYHYLQGLGTKSEVAATRGGCVQEQNKSQSGSQNRNTETNSNDSGALYATLDKNIGLDWWDITCLCSRLDWNNNSEKTNHCWFG
jgi:hypothetical protein